METLLKVFSEWPEDRQLTLIIIVIIAAMLALGGCLRALVRIVRGYPPPNPDEYESDIDNEIDQIRDMIANKDIDPQVGFARIDKLRAAKKPSMTDEAEEINMPTSRLP